MNTLNYIKADTHRHFNAFSWLLVAKGVITLRTFRPVLTMRLCQAVANSSGAARMTLPLFKILHRVSTQLAGMDFSWRTKIGAGFIITHGWGLVVNENSHIGKNVTLFHGVTLGQNGRKGTDGKITIGYPILEDEVWVGPNAVIVGGVTIGRGSRIAAGAFVTESLPPYSLVSGNPAKIIKPNCKPDVDNPAPL